MAIACLAKVSPLNPSTGSRVGLYIASAQDRAVTGLNGVVWEPAMTAPPTLSINLWQGDFREPVDTGGASFSINMGILKMTYAGCDAYNWAGAPVEIYAEEPGTAWPWATRFKGRVASYSRRNDVLTINATIETEAFDKNILTTTYAGTGGAEGGADLKGRLKPLVIGWAQNVEPILIDTVNNVYQFSGYGAIEAVSNLYERAADFGASVGDYATYAALVAATIPAGRWGTCLAAGMVRLGAPAAGVITGDLKGHKVGATTPRLSGAVISALATIAGVSTGDIETSTLTSLDAAVPYPINLVLTEQVTFRDMAAGLALACNWQSGITLVGKFFVLSVSLSGSEVITLNAQGTALPQVTSSDEQDVSVPYYLTIFGANRCWRVHTADEIAFTAALVERGTYSATETYREGNIVTTADGARWIYTNPVASSGNAPPTLPTTSNAYWSNMTAASPVAVLGFLTNDTHVVNADASGTVTSWTGAGGTFVVQENGATLSSGVTFSLVSATGVTVSINATTGVYSATAMSASTGTATFRAVYNGVTIDKIFSIAKSITGATGATGSTGATGPTGPAATSAYLTRESAVLFAYADGSVASYSTATGDFKVFAGSTDISSNFTLSTVNNPQSLTVSYASQTFTISAGFDPGEDSATLTIRATGSGAYAGVTFDKVFTLTKAKAGTNAKTMTVYSNRQSIAYDAAGSPTPSTQTTTFGVNKQNTTATVSWTLTDASGVNRTPVTSFLSAATGDSVTMTEAQFASARNGTSGVIVRATITDGTTITGTVSLVRVQEGAAGANGAPGVNAKTLRLTSSRQVINYDDDGLPTPATQTTTFSTLKQNTTATVNWSITDAAGVARTPVTSFLSASTGDSVTMTEAQFASARNGTTGVIVTASLTDGTVLSDTINVTRVQQGLPGVDAQILSLTSTGIAFSFNALGAASPSSQTLTFTANLQNVTGTITWAAVAYSSTGTNLGSITLSGTGNTRTMTNAQFMAPGAVAYAVVTATLGSLTDTCTVIKVSDGANGTNGSNGATGPSGLAAFLTNDSFSVPAYADGTVTTYSGATGSFKVFAGNTDVSSNFTLTTQANPQTLTVSYVGQAYTVTGGLDTSEDTASLTIRATGSGSYSGVTIDRVFSLGKNKGGYEIVGTLPSTNLFTGRVVFLTTDDKLYRYTGAAWSKAVDGADIIANSILTNSIAAGQITGAKLAATSIITLTAQIGDGLITNAKIGDAQITNAKIGNLQVDTLKIAGNAVTNTSSAYTSNAINLVDDAWVDVQTVTVVASSASLLILFTGQSSQLFSGVFDIIKYRILRDGLLIYGPIENWVYNDQNLGVSMSVVNSPPAGTRTYTVQAFLQTSGGSATMSQRSLVVLETKK